MEVSKDFTKKVEFDPEKVNETYEKLVKVFQEARLTPGEILIAYGNLGYTLGASIEGYKETGPAIEDLQKMYYVKPTLGVAMMLQSVECLNWFVGYEKEKIKETQGE